MDIVVVVAVDAETKTISEQRNLSISLSLSFFPFTFLLPLLSLLLSRRYCCCCSDRRTAVAVAGVLLWLLLAYCCCCHWGCSEGVDVDVDVDVNKWNSQHAICRGRYICVGMLCVNNKINDKNKTKINEDWKINIKWDSCHTQNNECCVINVYYLQFSSFFFSDPTAEQERERDQCR